MADVSLPSSIALSDAVMIVARTDGVIVHVTDGYCRMVGRPAEELVGRRADEVGLAGSSERLRWILGRLPEDGTGVVYRRVFETPDGPRLFDAHLHHVTGDLLVTVLLDVTSDAGHEDGEAVLSSFLDAAPVGVVVYDRDLRIVRVNRTVEEMGRVRPEHLGQRLTDAFSDVDPDALDAVTNVLDTGAAIANQRLVRPDGREFLLNFFPIRDATGINQVGCLFSDVTEVNRAERVIAAQRRAIDELSTPILELDDGLLVLPLVGVIDSDRAMQMTGRLLAAIGTLRGRMVVIDVTGVPVVDSALASHLQKTVQAARLMGATTIISGMSGEAALALARLGADLQDIASAGTLRDAVSEFRALTSGESPTHDVTQPHVVGHALG